MKTKPVTLNQIIKKLERSELKYSKNYMSEKYADLGNNLRVCITECMGGKTHRVFFYNIGVYKEEKRISSFQIWPNNENYSSIFRIYSQTSFTAPAVRSFC